MKILEDASKNRRPTFGPQKCTWCSSIFVVEPGDARLVRKGVNELDEFIDCPVCRQSTIVNGFAPAPDISSTPPTGREMKYAPAQPSPRCLTTEDSPKP